MKGGRKRLINFTIRCKIYKDLCLNTLLVLRKTLFRGGFKVRRTPVSESKNCLKFRLSQKINTVLLSCTLVSM